jgi:flagellar biogenesis protein FliO
VTGARLRAAAGIAVAVGVMALTSQAGAQEDPPRDTSSPPAEPATPLALRPGRSLELSQEPAHSSLGWKIVAVMAVLGGSALYLRKRSPAKPAGDDRLTIIRRTSVGIRSELLIVSVEGQRLLIGVTPHSIQSLASLDGEEAPHAVSGGAAAAAPLGDRFATMLGAAEARTDRPREDRASAIEEAAQSGQARGLLALRRRG